MIFHITIFQLPEKEYLIIPGERSNKDLPSNYYGKMLRVFSLDTPVAELSHASAEICKQLESL